ncbi:DUF4160 domain-containing protein [Geomonas terrae]|uniref:DUF4160 domain-containing protein n=1 Tax=Geomonas terrae TaxID=2562681 RepID=A0A4S1CHQ9_9BACT|nr:DUF4160 domain-containing protein [Geomonas terrae]TGU72943.1 DUF4160 domain-containing protein [Geomonas terrae]
MPTIMRFSTSRLTIYPNEHGLPHFHLEFIDGDRCSVAIETLEILVGEVNPPKKMAEAIKWAVENQALLFAKWEEITR